MSRRSTHPSAHAEKPKKLTLNKETLRRLVEEDPDNMGPTPTATVYKTCICSKPCPG